MPDNRPDPDVRQELHRRYRKIGITSASLPRWRTGRGFAGHKLVGHAEQVPQHIRIDARQANQHGVVADVVLRYVVNIGVRGKQLGAVIEIHAYDKRIGFPPPTRREGPDERMRPITERVCSGISRRWNQASTSPGASIRLTSQRSAFRLSGRVQSAARPPSSTPEVGGRYRLPSESRVPVRQVRKRRTCGFLGSRTGHNCYGLYLTHKPSTAPECTGFSAAKWTHRRPARASGWQSKTSV